MVMLGFCTFEKSLSRKRIFFLTSFHIANYQGALFIEYSIVSTPTIVIDRSTFSLSERQHMVRSNIEINVTKITAVYCYLWVGGGRTGDKSTVKKIIRFRVKCKSTTYKNIILHYHNIFIFQYRKMLIVKSYICWIGCNNICILKCNIT